MNGNAGLTSEESFRSWRRAALVVAVGSLLLGIAGEASDARFFTSLGLDHMAVLVWGVLYGILALMLPRRPSRALVAVVVFLVIDGVRLAFAAGDAGQGVPWLAILLRLGLAVPLVLAAFGASAVRQGATENRRSRRVP